MSIYGKVEGIAVRVQGAGDDAMALFTVRLGHPADDCYLDVSQARALQKALDAAIREHCAMRDRGHVREIDS